MIWSLLLPQSSWFSPPNLGQIVTLLHKDANMCQQGFQDEKLISFTNGSNIFFKVGYEFLFVTFSGPM